MTFRIQILLISLVTLLLPWGGCQYIREMESALRFEQRNSLLISAQAIAQIAQQQIDKFFWHSELINRHNSSHADIYAFPIHTSIVLDGYADDWGQLNLKKRSFYLPEDTEHDLQLNLITAKTHQHLYLFFQIQDDSVIYHNPTKSNLATGDHIQIILPNKQESRKYRIRTSAPGSVKAYYAATIQQENETKILTYAEPSITGQWQDTSTGYNIELRIPLNLIEHQIGLAVVDVDQNKQGNETNKYLGTFYPPRPNIIGSLIYPTNPDILNVLGEININAKISVIDHHGWVIANPPQQNHLILNTENTQSPSSVKNTLLTQFYRLILNTEKNALLSQPEQPGRITGNYIKNALKDNPQTSWHRKANSSRAIISAAYPIKINDQVVAAVILEQPTDAILTLTNRALVKLINTSFLAILLIVIGLLFYATMLSMRIRKLRNVVESTISDEGKITTQLPHSKASDELGDLSRSFSTLLNRLHEYTHYLKTLATKLSHELRTPLAVVQSSLDNLDNAQLSEDANIYSKRAKEGIQRLRNIIIAMSEATRVEHSITHSEAEQFDLNEVITSSFNAYKDLHTTQQFHINIENEHDYTLVGIPDLIVQMLDKLIDNAVDFTPNNGNISISLTKKKNNSHSEYEIRISNEGPILPKQMQQQLFDSMVSLRTEKSDSPHLGFGLYIVKLIVDHHQGNITAHNLPDNSGVEFTISIPSNRN